MKSFNACLALFRIRTAEALQYRAAALSNTAVGLFWAFIQLMVYSVFFRYAGNSGAGALVPLSLRQTVSYVWLLEALLGFVSISIDPEVGGKIVDGDVGVELCRPLDLYFHWFAKTAAGRTGGYWWRMVITLGAALLIPAPYRLSAPASAAAFALFAVTYVSGSLLALSYTMLMTAVRVGISWGDGPTAMMYILSAVLSGAYLPLQLWPDFMQKFLFLQPFAGTVDLPLRLYVGSMEQTGAFGVLAVQLCWTAAFISAGRLILRRKIKGIVVQGG